MAADLVRLMKDGHLGYVSVDAVLPRLAWLEIADPGKNGAIKLTDLDAALEPRNLRRLKADVPGARWGYGAISASARHNFSVSTIACRHACSVSVSR
jgi:hypothetical protein